MLSAAVMTAAVLLCAAVRIFFASLTIIMPVLIGIFMLAGAFCAFVWIPMNFRHLVCIITSGEIIKKSGFFVYRTQILKRSAVKYTKVLRFLCFHIIVFYGQGGRLSLFCIDIP